MRCIDIGCGSGGEVSLEIDRLVARGGTVVRVDMDARPMEGRHLTRG